MFFKVTKPRHNLVNILRPRLLRELVKYIIRII
jgi:hypothetical protein